MSHIITTTTTIIIIIIIIAKTALLEPQPSAFPRKYCQTRLSPAMSSESDRPASLL
jgi:hypothetical protein